MYTPTYNLCAGPRLTRPLHGDLHVNPFIILFVHSYLEYLCRSTPRAPATRIARVIPHVYFHLQSIHSPPRTPTTLITLACAYVYSHPLSIFRPSPSPTARTTLSILHVYSHLQSISRPLPRSPTTRVRLACVLLFILSAVIYLQTGAFAHYAYNTYLYTPTCIYLQGPDVLAPL